MITNPHSYVSAPAEWRTFHDDNVRCAACVGYRGRCHHVRTTGAFCDEHQGPVVSNIVVAKAKGGVQMDKMRARRVATEER